MDDLRTGPDGLERCGWVGDDPEYRRYHDEEWGVPLHGDRALFEKLSLEAFQSGLSWITILKRRPGFRSAFSDFEPSVVAGFDDGDVERLLADPGIIRNRAKVLATIANARVVAAWEPGSLDALIWSFAPPPGPARRTLSDVPATTEASSALSAELRGRGLRFVGPTTGYALMQSAGLVHDHLAACHRFDPARVA